eukprot:UC1_evm1s1941
MAEITADTSFYLRKAPASDALTNAVAGDEDGFSYGAVPADGGLGQGLGSIIATTTSATGAGGGSTAVEEEDLAATVAAVRLASAAVDNNNNNNNGGGVGGGSSSNITSLSGPSTSSTTPRLVTRPEAIEDFVRNWLLEMGLESTLSAFQEEWYAGVRAGRISQGDPRRVPDAYAENLALKADLARAHEAVVTARAQTDKAESRHGALRKERDYHRIAHRRILQTNARLEKESRMATQRVKELEAEVETVEKKLRGALKRAMMSTIGKEKAEAESQSLRRTLGGPRANGSLSGPVDAVTGARRGVNGFFNPSSTQDAAAAALAAEASATRRRPPPAAPGAGAGAGAGAASAASEPTPFPPSVAPSADTLRVPPSMNPMTSERAAAMKQVRSIEVAGCAIACLDFHPSRRAVVCGTDDGAFRVLGIPDGDPISAGPAHSGWVAACAFHPAGERFATAGGDATVRLWEVDSGEHVATFSDHAHAVWGLDYHYTGDFLASASMDNTVKIWDLNTGRARQTLRGHTDSVNCCRFQPHSNTLATGSADHCVALWDARTGLQRAVLKIGSGGGGGESSGSPGAGHNNAVNSVAFSRNGELIASTDADGCVVLWEVRTLQPLLRVDLGPHPLNAAEFDPTGAFLCLASGDSRVCVLNTDTAAVEGELVGHADTVLTARFDPTGEALYSTGADGSLRQWV